MFFVRVPSVQPNSRVLARKRRRSFEKQSRFHDVRIGRRRALVTLSAIGTVSVLVACGQQAGQAPTQAAAKTAPGGSQDVLLKPTPTQKPGIVGLPTPKSGQKVVQYWHNFGAGLAAEIHTKQILNFLNANSTYAVDVQYVPTTAGTQLSDKLIAAISGGDPPDAARFDRFIVTSWAARGFLSDLTDRAKRDGVTEDKFIKEGWLEATWRGKVYAVPFDTDLRGLYYNKKHIEAAGLDPNKPPTTIEELDQYADALTKKDGAKYSQMGFIPWALQGSLYTYGWIFGGEFYDRDKDVITLSLGLNFYRQEYDTAWGLMMAMSVCVTLPIIVLFFLVQRTFIQGITLTGIKG